jgi:hypothetical protein
MAENQQGIDPLPAPGVRVPYGINFFYIYDLVKRKRPVLNAKQQSDRTAVKNPGPASGEQNDYASI